MNGSGSGMSFLYIYLVFLYTYICLFVRFIYDGITAPCDRKIWENDSQLVGPNDATRRLGQVCFFSYTHFFILTCIFTRFIYDDATAPCNGVFWANGSRMFIYMYFFILTHL